MDSLPTESNDAGREGASKRSNPDERTVARWCGILLALVLPGCLGVSGAIVALVSTQDDSTERTPDPVIEPVQVTGPFTPLRSLPADVVLGDFIPDDAGNLDVAVISQANATVLIPGRGRARPVLGTRQRSPLFGSVDSATNDRGLSPQRRGDAGDRHRADPRARRVGHGKRGVAFATPSEARRRPPTARHRHRRLRRRRPPRSRDLECAPVIDRHVLRSTIGRRRLGVRGRRLPVRSISACDHRGQLRRRSDGAR